MFKQVLLDDVIIACLNMFVNACLNIFIKFQNYFAMHLQFPQQMLRYHRLYDRTHGEITEKIRQGAKACCLMVRGMIYLFNHEE